MTRTANKPTPFRERSRFLPAWLMVLLLADGLTIPSIPVDTRGPVAVEAASDSAEGPRRGEDCSLQARRPDPRVPQREGPAIRESVRHLLDLRPHLPVAGSRLDYCVEFTKPDSLKIRLTGTPKSHRSPPAAPLSFPAGGSFLPSQESVSCGPVIGFRGC
jgi:hypothetical protein